MSIDNVHRQRISSRVGLRPRRHSRGGIPQIRLSYPGFAGRHFRSCCCGVAFRSRRSAMLELISFQCWDGQGSCWLRVRNEGLAGSLADRGGLASVRHCEAQTEVRSGRGGGDRVDSPGVSAGSHCPRGRMCGSTPPSAPAFSRASLGCCGIWRTGELLCAGRGDLDSPIKKTGRGPRQRSLRY